MHIPIYQEHIQPMGKSNTKYQLIQSLHFCIYCLKAAFLETPHPTGVWLQYETVSGRSLATVRLDWINDPIRLISSMLTELIGSVNYNPGICQKLIKFRDKPHVISLMTIEKVTKQKLILPFIVHSCLHNTPIGGNPKNVDMNIHQNCLKQSFPLPFVAQLATNGNWKLCFLRFLIRIHRLFRAFLIATYPVCLTKQPRHRLSRRGLLLISTKYGSI